VSMRASICAVLRCTAALYFREQVSACLQTITTCRRRAQLWSLLYALIGASAFVIWTEGGFAAQQGPLALLGVNMVLNLAWMPARARPLPSRSSAGSCRQARERARAWLSC